MTAHLIGEGRFTFEVSELWPGPGPHAISPGWAHHGAAVTEDGDILTFHAARSELLVLDQTGRLLRSVPVDVVQGHGFTLVEEDGTPLLWIADTGAKARPQADGSYLVVPRGNGAAVQISLDGSPRMRLDAPDISMYRTKPFRPTQVAVDERRFGGSGDIWIADGYGAEVVHRYHTSGMYIATLNGSEGAGLFAQPHSVFIDRRGQVPELYIADRLNRRIQVFDLNGRFQRSFGEGYLLSPSGFAPYGDYLLIAELDARIVVVDANDNRVGVIGRGSLEARQRPGWPNATAAGRTVSPSIPPDEFNTPHAIATDRNGTIFVVEWLIGGRLVALIPRPGQ